MFKSGFFLRFASGFALGAVGIVALQPAEARQDMVNRIAPTHVIR